MVYNNIIICILVVFTVVFLCTLNSCPYKEKHNETFYNNNEERTQNRPSFTPDDFDVYLINMNKNRDRLQHFMKQWKSTDLKDKKFKRLSAVNGSEINISTYLSDRAYKEVQTTINNGYRTKHYQLTRGAIGCYLSHLKTYDKIANGDKPYGIILEYDVKITKNFYKLAKGVVKEIPSDWDILLLSCHCITCKRQQLYSKVDKFIWLHCYIVSKEGASKLKDILNSKPIEQQIDSELSDLAEERLIKIYCVNQSLSTQSQNFATSIQMPMRYVKNINPYSKPDGNTK